MSMTSFASPIPSAYSVRPTGSEAHTTSTSGHIFLNVAYERRSSYGLHTTSTDSGTSPASASTWREKTAFCPVFAAFGSTSTAPSGTPSSSACSR